PAASLGLITALQECHPDPIGHLRCAREITRLEGGPVDAHGDLGRCLVLSRVAGREPGQLEIVEAERRLVVSADEEVVRLGPCPATERRATAVEAIVGHRQPSLRCYNHPRRRNRITSATRSTAIRTRIR